MAAKNDSSSSHIVSTMTPTDRCAAPMMRVAAVAHAAEAGAAPADRRILRQPDAIVGDLEHHLSGSLLHTNVDPSGPGVLVDIQQGFLGNTEQCDLDGRRHPQAAIGVHAD